VEIDVTDIDHVGQGAAVAKLRLLARHGTLAQTARTSAPTDRALLSGAAFTLAWPIVFHRLTRTYELRRGHWSCASGVERLADGCLDRFYDDVEAVVDDLLNHATTSILNAEGWITARLRAVTVDAHRRRRGARGALQRPLLPAWLAARLGHDAWLTELAVEILVWVGVASTAGTQLWPLDDWAQRRLSATGDVVGCDARGVQRDVDRVLKQMATRPTWYADYVERPLGAKTPPQAPDSGSSTEPPPLILTEQHEVEDRRLTELAALALQAIEAQLAANPEDEEIIPRTIATVFGRIDYHALGAETPGTAAAGEMIDELIKNPAELRRIAEVVRDILA
jgi:hypothetical protein